jgi:hypothetical protein
MSEMTTDTRWRHLLGPHLGWLVSWLAIQITGLIMMLSQPTVLRLSVPVYLLGAAGSGLFWWLLARLSNELQSRWVCLVYSALLGVLTATLVVVGAGMYSTFRSFGTPSIALAVQPWTALRYIIALTHWWITTGFFALWLLSAMAWRLSIRYRKPMRRWRTAIAAIMVATGLAAGIPYAGSHLLPPDSAGLSILGYISTQRVAALRAPTPQDPVVPPDDKVNANWDIVIICHETWSPRWLPAFEQHRRSLFPRITDWSADQHARGLGVWFRRHLATSVWTELAVPTLLAGTGLEEGLPTLHRRPLIWEWYDAAGFRTGFFSSQYYRVSNLHEFMFDRGGLDHKETVSTMSSDTWFFRPDGVDDLRAAELAGEFIRSTGKDQPLFMFAMSNAMHHPFQRSSERMEPLPDDLTPFEKGARIADEFTLRIIDSLRRADRLDRTFVVVLGDHGTQDPQLQHGARLTSYYEPVTRTPLFVRVPEDFRQAHPDQWQQLQANADHVTSHVDIVPTLLDISGLLPESTHDSRNLVGRGRALTTQSAEGRAVFMVVRTGSRLTSSFFVMAYDTWRIGVSEVSGVRAYNLASDPTQQHNLWPDVPEDVRSTLQRSIREHPGLRAVYRRCLRKRCQPGLQDVIGVSAREP